MKTKNTETAFGHETKGHKFEGVWFELHYRSKDGSGEWYCTPSYRRIAESDVPAKIAEWKKTMGATTFDVGGLTLQFIDKRKQVYEVRIIKRESVCTVISAEVFETK